MKEKEDKEGKYLMDNSEGKHMLARRKFKLDINSPFLKDECIVRIVDEARSLLSELKEDAVEIDQLFKDTEEIDPFGVESSRVKYVCNRVTTLINEMSYRM